MTGQQPVGNVLRSPAAQAHAPDPATDRPVEKPLALMPEQMMRGNHDRLASIDARLSALLEATRDQTAALARMIAVMEGGGAPAWMGDQAAQDGSGGAPAEPASDGKPRCREHPDAGLVRRSGKPWCPLCKAAV